MDIVICITYVFSQTNNVKIILPHTKHMYCQAVLMFNLKASIFSKLNMQECIIDDYEFFTPKNAKLRHLSCILLKYLTPHLKLSP